MLKFKPILSLTVVGLSLSLLSSSKVLAFSFNFSPIAETSSSFSSFSSLGSGLGTAGGNSGYKLSNDADYQNGKGLAINNNGQVVFFAELTSGDQGIYVGTGVGGPKIIVDNKSDSIFSSFGQGLALNNDGTVAFFADVDAGGQGIFTSNGVRNTQQIAHTSGTYSSFAPGLAINDSGTVAFFANLDNGGQEIFTSDGNKTIQITNCIGAGSSEQQCPLSSSMLDPLAPDINNQGMVSFVSHYGVFTGDENGNYLIVADQTNFWNGSYREANINDQGQVSAFAHNNGAGQVIFKADGINGELIAGNNYEQSETPDTFYNVGTSSINNKGLVAFMANQVVEGSSAFSNQDKGIFVGSNAVEDKVIGIGDTLFGSTVVDLAMDRQSLSDDNEIVFWAKLEDGTEGIYRANNIADSQFNPLLPDSTLDGVFRFIDVIGGKWYDPPSAYGFHYEMTGDSLFTSILNFPVGFENPFTVSVGDTNLGEFLPGDSIDFVSLLGNGVSEFTITGLDVDPTNPTAFPIKLDFDTDTASFDMHALIEEDSQNVPEPVSVFSLLTFGSAVVLLRRQKSRQV
ncbi:MAG: choice-of-anchor tandem repeat NxxGxxAF-containing protein [Coleofasciculus sp.]|uniref:DUF7453 family protein n=1 Tax=Coleofasciculus sp. TaxID=3100458 RepID=UPI003A3BCC52